MLLWWSDNLPLLYLFSAMMAGPAMAILEHLAAARWLGFEPRMNLLAGLARIEAWLVGLFLAFQMGDLFYRGAADAMFTASWFAVSFWVEIIFGLMLPLCSPDDAGGAREPARARHGMHFGDRWRVTAPAERGRDRLARAPLGNLLAFLRRGRHNTRALRRRPCLCLAGWRASCRSMKSWRRRKQAGACGSTGRCIARARKGYLT